MARRWALLFGGMTGAGKSSLIAALLGTRQPVLKTQSLVFHGSRCIDSPGEYLMHPHLRQNFLSTAADVRAVLFLQSADARNTPLPSDFLRAVGHVPVIGAVSRTDVAGADIPRAKQELLRLGIKEPFFEISVNCPEAVDALREHLTALQLWTPAGESQ